MMVTDYIRSDGHSSDTPSVTSLTWKCVAVVLGVPVPVCLSACAHDPWSVSNASRLQQEKEGDDTLGCSRLSVAWVFGSLHATLIMQETVKECWVKLIDEHLNKRKRAVDRGVYTDVMLHHLSGNTFCSHDSSSDFAITDLQVAAASFVWGA